MSKGPGNRLDQRTMPDADQLPRYGRRVSDHPQNVQTGANTKAPADIADTSQLRMKLRRKDKRQTGSAKTRLDDRCLVRDLDTEFAEHIGTTRFAGHATI